MHVGPFELSAPERALIARADGLLSIASRQIQLLGCASPVNFGAELGRITTCWRTGDEVEPAFAYGLGPQFDLGLPLALDDAARELDGGGVVARLYAGRARELALEAQLCVLRGDVAVPALAARRYAVDVSIAELADTVAREWLTSELADPETVADVISDDLSDPRSLVRRMREVVGERRLPLKVVIARSLAPLAAIGDGTVQIAPSRLMRVEDVERTVLHEIDGHAVPAIRAERASIGLFAIGTARGSDTQEGWAIRLEQRAGYLGPLRKRELGLRHLAARDVHRGRSFGDVVRRLTSELGAPLEPTLRVVARAFRGGGLGRESAYLPAFIEVEAALSSEPEIEQWLASGRVSVAAARSLAQHPALLPAAS